MAEREERTGKTVGEKGNEHIRRDKSAFTHAYLRARKELGKLEGVVGVGFGRKEVKGKFTDDVAIEVFVREKKADHQLPDGQRVPKRYEGYLTDVRVMPRGREAADTGGEDLKTYPTIQGGISIESFPRTVPSPFPSPGDRGPGTLGCIVRKRGGGSGKDNVFLLTCGHVLRTLGAGNGDYVYQPHAALLEGGVGEGRIIATIEGEGVGYVPGRSDLKEVESETALVPDSPTHEQHDIFCYVDAGIAKIDAQSKCCDTPCGTGGISVDETIVGLTDLGLTTNAITDVRNLLLDVDITLSTSDKHVYKRGERTRGTIGLVTAVNAPLWMYDLNNQPLREVFNVLEIAYEVTTARPKNNLGNHSFADHGDSGAIVVDGQNRAVGMIFASEHHPNKTTDDEVLTFKNYACHIVAVLDALKVCIATSGGTHYGADGANDGSGLSLSAIDRTSDSGGERAFAAAERSGTPVRSATGAAERPNFAPLTEAQRERFIRARDAIRETPRGRRLDDTFLEVRQEIGVLVRNCRPVTVAWHRNRGPAFLAHVINHLRGDAESIPREIGGVSRATLLTRMRDVLLAHGSDALRRALERHGPDLLLLAESESVEDCVATLRRLESTETPA